MQMVSDDEIEASSLFFFSESRNVVRSANKPILQKEAPEVSCNLFDLCSVYSFALTTPTEEDPRFMDSKVEKLLRQVSVSENLN